jgi:hypothetical protein
MAENNLYLWNNPDVAEPWSVIGPMITLKVRANWRKERAIA